MRHQKAAPKPTSIRESIAMTEPASSADKADIGLIGLAVMGQNLALNIADHGFRIAVHNRTQARTEEFLAGEDAKGKDLVPAHDLKDFVEAIERPRAIILMVKAGDPVDQQIAALLPLLDEGDVIVDGGNADYHHTIRREAELKEKGILFVGTGISGGEEGARHGPSIMAGGDAQALERVAPVFEAIAAKVDGEPCYAHIAADGAGHFVKMLHNGIEYADMQLIAETYALMKDLAALDYPVMQDVFTRWNRGELDSYLIEITADILGKHDPETGEPMAEIILDKAGQKGTGGWSVKAAIDYGAPAPTIAAAVEARTLSSYKSQRVEAANKLQGPTAALDLERDAFIEQLEAALLAAKIAAYAQGFAVIDAAASAHDWDIDRGKVASIWRGGCIIRARFLRYITTAYRNTPDLPNLMLDAFFAASLDKGQHALRNVVALAAKHGVPVPALASALAYYDGYRSARLPANLIQAQRDYFGAHTSERTDREGVFHHDWSS
jgi:6-phosphogluconate dehydrogenase